MSPIRYLFVGLFAAYTGLMAANPVFPPLARDLGLAEWQAGLIISVAALSLALSSPFWGARSERYGRRSVFVLGLIGFGLALGVFAAMTHLGLAGVVVGIPLLILLILSRSALGALMGAAAVAGQAWVADTTTAETRSAGMATLGAANGLGLVAGPAVATVLVGFGLLAPLYAGAALVVAVGLVMAWRMPSSAPPAPPETAARLRPWDGRVAPFLLIGLVAVVAIVLLQITIGFFFIDRFGLTSTDAARVSGIAFFAVGIVLVATQGVLVRRMAWSPRTLIGAGLPVMTAGMALLVGAGAPWVVVVAFVVMGVGAGLIFPGYMAGATLAVGPQEQGAIAGLNVAANGVGAVIGPLLGAGLYELAPALPYQACLVLLAALTVFGWLHPRIRQAQGAAAATVPAGDD